MPFVERGLSLARANRFLTFILPSKFTETESGSNLRTLLTENHSIIHYTNIKYQVFSSATTYTCVLTAQKDVSRDSFRFSRVKSREAFSNIDSHQISNDDLSDNTWNLEKYDTDLFPLSQKLKQDSRTVELQEIFKYISKGIDPGGSTDIFVLNQKEANKFDLESEYLQSVILGDGIQRYDLNTTKTIIFPYKIVDEKYIRIPEDDLRGTNVYDYLRDH